LILHDLPPAFWLKNLTHFLSSFRILLKVKPSSAFSFVLIIYTFFVEIGNRRFQREVLFLAKPTEPIPDLMLTPIFERMVTWELTITG